MDTTQSLNTTLPGAAPLPFDATLLFKALQYQLLVAVEYCYDLAPDESLWLEVMGDVTVPGKTQTEVKLYSDNLTDSHANFWNTLKNWLHENFDRTSFKTLVLLTTQEFGAQTLLKGWNAASAAERLSIMEHIVAGSQANAGNQASNEPEVDEGANKPSKSQKLQQYVMDPKRRDALMEVLERMQITTGAESLEQRLKSYETRHLKPIRPSKYRPLIHELLGFMCSPDLVINGWQITYQAFTDKLSELTHRYMKHPKTFPSVDMAALKKSIDIEEIRPMRFAHKILEIGGEQQLKRAALHRVVAQTTISDLYTDGVLFKPMMDLYLSNHLTQHKYGRELAMVDCAGITCSTELSTRSMKFFLMRNGLPTDSFCGLEHTMPEFRNGIYHMLAGEQPEDEDDEFHWRLW
ncbi:hypothetical protein [uncultured Massilia sp.]|uniref:hypothetical protein n=1 Tax=uncultured Massilia sp. TaxID=169973 RepID=UPI0025ECB307|nr:hypothetical protein [uncultured Massilia sp.]